MPDLPGHNSEKTASLRACPAAVNLRLLITVMLAFGIFTTIASSDQVQAQTPGVSANDKARLASLKSKRDSLWRQLAQAGGASTPKKSVNNIKYRMNVRKVQVDSIEKSVKQMVGNKNQLIEMKRQLTEKYVISLSDWIGEGGEGVVGVGTKKVLNKGGRKAAGKALGWVALVGDIIEYGGKKIIKELDVNQLEDYVAQNRLSINQLLLLERSLLYDNDADRQLLAEVRQLMKRYDQADDEYLSEKQKLARLSEDKRNSNEPEKIADFCSFVPDQRARAGCYGIWSKLCSGMLTTKGLRRCKATLSGARGGGSTGKIWNICAKMKPDYKKRCYGFGKIVKRLCQFVPPGRERTECLRNVRRIPSKG